MPQKKQTKKQIENKNSAIKACEESNLEYKEIFDQIKDGLVFLNLRGKIKKTNKAFCKLVGVKEKDLINKNVFLSPLVKKLKIENPRSIFKKIIKGKKKVLSPIEIKSPAKKKVYLEIRTSLVKRSKKVQGVVAIIRNVSQRIEAQKKIQDNREKYYNLFEKIPFAIGLFNKNLKVRELNEAFLKLFKIDKGKAENLKFNELFLDKKEKTRALAELKKLKALNNFQTKLGVEEAKHFWANINATEIEMEGQAFYLISIIDFSRRKKALEVLQKSEQRYRSLFVNMIQGFALHKIITDKKGRPRDYVFIEVNDYYERLTGLKKEDFGGRLVTEVMPDIKKDSIDWIKIYGEAALKNKSKRFEAYSKNLKKWFRISAYSPSPGYFVTLVDDITEQKEAQKLINKAKQRLELHVKNTPLGVIEWDKDFKITRWNPAAEKIFGYTKKEAVGKTGLLIIRKKDKKELLKLWKTILAKKGGERAVNENITKEGEVKTCDWYNTPLINQKNKVMGVASLVLDITERVKMQQQLKSNLEELEAMNKLMVGRELKMVELKDRINQLEFILKNQT
ncbi:MAG: PAS domain S-box protein [Candidatus Moranbacteria bacterium]|nr:PAS domain S-box protein [Candidatus Moranbacteria bacterium]